MRTLLIIIILFAAIGYFLFGYEPKEKQEYVPDQTQEYQLRQELGAETKSYKEGVSEGLHKVKNIF